MPRTRATVQPVKSRPPELLRKLIDVAMDLERRTMRLYCTFESMFPEPAEVRAFWFDMAQHESRHYGALALVAGLLESTPERDLPAAPRLTRAHIVHLRDLLTAAEKETQKRITLRRAFEIALAIESSEIEDLVLDVLTFLKGEAERERAVHLLIHDLGDLSYMIEKYARSKTLLAQADHSIEQQLTRLRGDQLSGARPPSLRPGEAKRGRRSAR